jgi:enamidase
VSTLVENVGRVVTGRLEEPIVDVDSVYVEDGEIREVGATTTTADTTIDANGLTLTPGLIDSHVHPVFGDYTPRQRTLGWCESYRHGGITSMISNGEPHLPGRPDDVASAKSLATLARKSTAKERPGGVKVRGGTLILDGDMTEDDIEDVHREGVRRLKFLMPVENRERARNLVRWGHDRDMIVLMHCGGTSLPGVKSTDAEMFVDIQPDIAAHVNGGPTPIPDAEVERLVEDTDIVLDLVLAGNQRLAVEVLEMAAARDELHRVQLGTDTPSGTGVTPLGVLLVASTLAGMTDVPAETVLCLATGTTARHHDLDTGRVEAGRPADLTLMGPPKGSQADTALDALDGGSYPAVDTVLVDGEVVVDGSRNTAPSKTTATIERS